MELLKIAGSLNPADLMTKGMPEDLMMKHLKTLALNYEEGRPEIAAKLMLISKKDIKKCVAYVSSITLRRKKNSARHVTFAPPTTLNH